MLKPKLPWRSRHQKQSAVHQERPQTRPLSERTGWILIAALTAVMGWIAANAVSALENLEKLPNTADRVYGKVTSWYYDDSAWTGVWSTKSEGFVDHVELSAIDVRVELVTDRGVIDGTIASPGLCRLLPLFAYVLLEGRVVDGRVRAVAYDFIGGVRQNLFQIDLHRDGGDASLLRVKASGGHAQALPPNALIRLHPGAKPMDPDDRDVHAYCVREREEFLSRLPGRPSADGRRHPIRDLKRFPVVKDHRG